jgi:hypothetical protein
MERIKMIQRVRSLTRDLTSSIFREQDILDFLDEGIDRIKQILPIMKDMTYLTGDNVEPTHLPSHYHSLIPMFATARCFAQDERNYQASTYMNEFETKMEELRIAIEDGTVVILDTAGVAVESGNDSFYVTDNYFTKSTGTSESFDYPDDEELPDSSGSGEIILDGGGW